MGIRRLLFRISIWSVERTRNQERGQSSHRPKPEDQGGSVLPLTNILQLGELRGRCYVIDGDTIVINRIKIRLAGIDAPELDQPWGQKAKWAMVALCKGQIVTAVLTGERSYDRLIATCFLPDGRDIGAELIKQGLALDGGYFSNGKYRHLEPRGVRRKIMWTRFRN